jgi:hypothetical protein
MHIVSRLFAGVSLLLTAAINSSVAITLLQLLISSLILINLEQGYDALKKSAVLLRWFIIPTVLLHAFFTPGELVVSGMPVPITVEGLQTGLWFALHLTVIFFSAVVFSRLLTNREWIRSVLRLPFMGAKMVPYVLLMEAGWSRTKIMLQDEYSAWRKHENGMRNFIMHLAYLPVKSLRQSHQHANEVWSNWDSSILAILSDESGRNVSVTATMTAVAGGLLMWYACLSVGM